MKSEYCSISVYFSGNIMMLRGCEALYSKKIRPRRPVQLRIRIQNLWSDLNPVFIKIRSDRPGRDLNYHLWIFDIIFFNIYDLKLKLSKIFFLNCNIFLRKVDQLLFRKSSLRSYQNQFFFLNNWIRILSI